MALTSLKRIVERHDTREGRAFSFAIQSLIVISLVACAIDTLPDLSEPTRRWLHAVEAITIAVFTVEYLLRVAAADNKLKFIFSFYGIIDLLAVLPFYFTTSVDLRSLRAFRLFRLIRILKLVRYSRALRRFHRAFLIAKEELALYVGLTLLLLYLSATGIYHFEHEAQPDKFQSVPHSLWWAVATLTTVGYGDVYPITPGGRFFTFTLLLIGLGVVAVPAGLVASALAQAREMEDDE